VLAPPYPAIFKTGTANQFQDIIALGATTRYTAGVWMGNFSGETVVGRTGSSIPAEVARALLDALVARDEAAGIFAEQFALPEQFAFTNVCALSGLIPTRACPSVTREFAPLGLEGALEVCAWHSDENGRAAVRYPADYQRWFMAKNSGASLFDAGGAPQFLYPVDGAVFVYENAQNETVQRLSVDCAGGEAQTARLFVNGTYAGESARPFWWNVPLVLGEMRLRVECAGENAEISVMVR
jgi:penicillin-binding protein 1C